MIPPPHLNSLRNMCMVSCLLSHALPPYRHKLQAVSNCVASKSLKMEIKMSLCAGNGRYSKVCEQKLVSTKKNSMSLNLIPDRGSASRQKTAVGAIFQSKCNITNPRVGKILWRNLGIRFWLRYYRSRCPTRRLLFPRRTNWGWLRMVVVVVVGWWRMANMHQ